MQLEKASQQEVFDYYFQIYSHKVAEIDGNCDEKMESRDELR